MRTDFALNSFTQLILGEQDCLLISPKKEIGLQHLVIPRAEKPDLYELFSDLSKVRLDFLDIENDLNDEERELLCDYGVLVAPENAPQKPLFACALSDVAAAGDEFAGDFAELTVNPSFRFQTVDLDNFGLWIQEKNLSPYRPSVWIKTLFTEIQIGYWLDEKQAEIVSGFIAGEKPSAEIEGELLSRLTAAEVLISDRIIKQRKETRGQTLKLAQKNFKENNYAVLRDLLPPAQMKSMRDYYREYVRNGFMPFGDNQVNRRYYQHNEPLARVFHDCLTRLMSLIAGEPVKPSYVYAASYKEGADLKPHVDRDACEFSFSFQVDYLPEQQKNLSPWALYLSHRRAPEEGWAAYDWDDFQTDPAESTAVYLASGDCLAYKGRELVHYRDALPAGHQSTSLFFHYVPQNFEGNLI